MSSDDILTLITILDTLLLGLVCFFLLFRFSILPYSLKIFSFFSIFAFSIQLSAFVIPYFGYYNLWLLHLLTLGEFLFLSFFYRELFIENPKIKRFIDYSLPIGFVLIILNSILLEPLTDYNNIAKTTVQCIIITYSVYYFYIVSTREILTEERFKSLHVINSAILVYYAGSFFIFMFATVSKLTSGDMSLTFWIFHAVLYLIFLIMVLTSIYKIIKSD